MGAEDVVDLLEADAEREQFVAPALLAGKIEWRRMALVLAGAGIDQNGVARRANHKRLVGNKYLAGSDVEHLRLHAGEMMFEYRVVIGREEILRPPPRSLALDHRVDGDVADPELLHGCLAPAFLRQRIGRHEQVQAEGSNAKSAIGISFATPVLPARCARHIPSSRRQTGECLRVSAPARGLRARPENAGHARRTAWCPRIPTAR